MRNNLIHFIVLYGIIITLIFFLFKKKNCVSQEILIEIPEKTGDFKPVEENKVEKTKDSIVFKKEIIYLENEVNKELSEKYIQAVREKDSLEQLNLYLSAVQIRTYNYHFENEDLDLFVDVETTGFLNQIYPQYTIKKQSLTIPIETKNFRSIYGGLRFSNSQNLDNFLIEGSLGFRNKKDNLFVLGYNTRKEISFTYLIKIFNY